MCRATAAGFGVANDGTTYHGPLRRGGVQPPASASVPVLRRWQTCMRCACSGCAGTTSVVTDGIDWAVHNNMDVINMSLGGVFGTSTNADSIASDNAAKAGIVVVASAGNAGPAPYVTGDPASANDSISVAAMDARPFIVNGLQIALSTGSTADGVEGQ